MVWTPPGVTSTTRLLLESATKTFPAPSTATSYPPDTPIVGKRGLDATGRNLHHPCVIGNEDVACCIDGYAGYASQSGAGSVLCVPGPKAARRLANAVERRGRNRVAGVVEERYCAHAQSRRERGEVDVDGARIPAAMAPVQVLPLPSVKSRPLAPCVTTWVAPRVVAAA